MECKRITYFLLGIKCQNKDDRQTEMSLFLLLILIRDWGVILRIYQKFFIFFLQSSNLSFSLVFPYSRQSCPLQLHFACFMLFLLLIAASNLDIVYVLFVPGFSSMDISDVPSVCFRKTSLYISLFYFARQEENVFCSFPPFSCHLSATEFWLAICLCCCCCCCLIG